MENFELPEGFVSLGDQLKSVESELKKLNATIQALCDVLLTEEQSKKISELSYKKFNSWK